MEHHPSDETPDASDKSSSINSAAQDYENRDRPLANSYGMQRLERMPNIGDILLEFKTAQNVQYEAFEKLLKQVSMGEIYPDLRSPPDGESSTSGEISPRCDSVRSEWPERWEEICAALDEWDAQHLPTKSRVEELFQSFLWLFRTMRTGSLQLDPFAVREDDSADDAARFIRSSWPSEEIRTDHLYELGVSGSLDKYGSWDVECLKVGKTYGTIERVGAFPASSLGFNESSLQSAASDRMGGSLNGMRTFSRKLRYKPAPGLVPFRDWCLLRSLMHQEDKEGAEILRFVSRWSIKTNPRKSFHVRYFRICSVDEPDTTYGAGVKLERRKVELPHLPGTTRTFIQECRSCIIGTRTDQPDNQNVSPYILLTLSNDPRRIGHALAARRNKKEVNTESILGMFFYLKQVITETNGTCDQAITSWEEIVDRVDEGLNLSFDNLLNPKTLQRIIMDRNSRSLPSTYFALSKVLRLFSEWVDETANDLDQAIDGILDKISNWRKMWDSISHHQKVKRVGITELDADGFILKVEQVRSSQKERLRSLRDHIQATRDEIMMLQDILFSTASLEEAIESNKQARYVFVFTIMTVVYLPLSFVTSFFGMNNLTPHNAWIISSMIPFAAMVVISCVLTYVIAGWLSYLITEEEKPHISDPRSSEQQGMTNNEMTSATMRKFPRGAHGSARVNSFHQAAFGRINDVSLRQATSQAHQGQENHGEQHTGNSLSRYFLGFRQRGGRRVKQWHTNNILMRSLGRSSSQQGQRISDEETQSASVGGLRDTLPS